MAVPTQMRNVTAAGICSQINYFVAMPQGLMKSTVAYPKDQLLLFFVVVKMSGYPALKLMVAT